MRKFIPNFTRFVESMDNDNNIPSYLDFNGYSYLNTKINRENYLDFPKEIFYISENDTLEDGVRYIEVFRDYRKEFLKRKNAEIVLEKYDVDEYDDSLTTLELYFNYVGEDIDTFVHNFIQSYIIDEFGNDLWANHMTILEDYLNN